MPEGLLLHILDEFLLVAPSKHICQQYLNKCYISEVGIPMATKKTVGTSQVLTFLGVELDTIKKQARLPENRLNKCLSQINEFVRRKSHFTGNTVTLWSLEFCLSGDSARASLFTPII